MTHEVSLAVLERDGRWLLQLRDDASHLLVHVFDATVVERRGFAHECLINLIRIKMGIAVIILIRLTCRSAKILWQLEAGGVVSGAPWCRWVKWVVWFDVAD